MNMPVKLWPFAAVDKVDFRYGSGIKLQANKVSFEPAVGPSLERRRATLALREHEMKLRLSAVQTETFLGFYEDTLKHGVFPFTGLTDPFGSAKTFRIADEPTFLEVGRGVWDISLKLEEVPS